MGWQLINGKVMYCGPVLSSSLKDYLQFKLNQEVTWDFLYCSTLYIRWLHDHLSLSTFSYILRYKMNTVGHPEIWPLAWMQNFVSQVGHIWPLGGQFFWWATFSDGPPILSFFFFLAHPFNVCFYQFSISPYVSWFSLCSLFLGPPLT